MFVTRHRYLAGSPYTSLADEMKLLIVNPNSTTDMTARMFSEAGRWLKEGVFLSALTNDTGPAAIEGADDGEHATRGTLDLLSNSQYDVAIVGCFDDVGLSEARIQTTRQIVGLGEAAYQYAASQGHHFAVLTTSQKSLPVLKRNLSLYGLEAHCAGVFASQIGVLEFEDARESALCRLIDFGRQCLEKNPNIDVFVLGCAGMGGLKPVLEEALGVLVVDPIEAAVGQAISRAECLVAVG